jgi:hypothetical protein
MNRKFKNKSQELERHARQLEARAAEMQLQLDKLEKISNQKAGGG